MIQQKLAFHSQINPFHLRLRLSCHLFLLVVQEIAIFRLFHPFQLFLERFHPDPSVGPTVVLDLLNPLLHHILRLCLVPVHPLPRLPFRQFPRALCMTVFRWFIPHSTRRHMATYRAIRLRCLLQAFNFHLTFRSSRILLRRSSTCLLFSLLPRTFHFIHQRMSHTLALTRIPIHHLLLSVQPLSQPLFGYKHPTERQGQ
jgi:hypothetical protein